MVTAILLNVLWLALSLFLLIKGSDLFIDAAEKIGVSLGISPFVIGLTIVAFGTSLPELASSISAMLSGETSYVASVVIGSNTTNILLVLGLVATFGKEIRMDYDIMDIDMPLLVGSAFLMYFTFNDMTFTLFESLLFVAGLIIFLVNSIAGNHKIDAARKKIRWKDILFLVLGGVGVKFGADFTVDMVQRLSDQSQINSDALTSTVVALGTSLPEVVVSITAAMKGRPGIAVGNVLGSNLFNSYAIIAIPSFIGPIGITTDMLTFGIPFMIVASIIFALISIGGRITKWEGLMLLIFYMFFIYQSFI